MTEHYSINLKEKFSKFSDYWNPRIVGDLNGQLVKLAKFHGEFVWHSHENEDELFFVIEGRLLIRFRDKDVWVEKGEIVIVPAKTEHQPVAQEEVHVMLFEPKSTLNTGNVIEKRTRNYIEKI